ncbi:haloacid dehalogenase type II [Hasllibacter sp. MH4015]|uniref:haloacid dehalogenase type II n=1 Tax=Hasllibacter sp. MH4015 TaxID=2854029 RepID=UPI001CD2D26C|nr:haloacid dehalogenase type II [Hasllibacter sp. MH4015]
MSGIKVCVFDAYGTLFDVAAAARALAAEPGREAFASVWQQVAADWRVKQLSYSWLRAVAGDHCDFWQVTCDALDWALDRAAMAEPDLREALLGLYWTLDAYPEVPEMLAALKGAGLQTAILSNGSPEMLKGAVESAGISPLLDAVLSVEDVGVFKPDARVYDMVGARFGCTREEVLFVSSNGWDAAFGAAYGFDTLWVNRAGEPMDRLSGRPGRVADDLTGVPVLAGVV